ncbi:MAG: alanine--glyoxylate aminotransferase family protein [Defluviitaleaceae bacterium]|nr:alanine--glyoxylate aminotransferase family protein [Defluviitaleaceae bacterium]
MVDRRLVKIPGPTPVVDSIRVEMGREIQAFGDPRFVKDFKEVIDDLHEMFGCDGKTFVVAGTGTLAMEMAIANSTKKGDNVLIISHGFFGDRFIEICERKGLNVDVLKSEWGKTIPLSEIEAKLKEKQYAVMTVSHVDTSTSVVADVAAIGAMMKNFPETLYIVDGVCSSAAQYENLAEMNIDILFTGTQKAFGVCPGLLMLWANQKAMKRREELGTIPEYYCDYYKWLPTMEDPAKYFATPAVNLIWALQESIRLIKEEGGLKVRYERHLKNAKSVQKALLAMGFTLLAEEGCRAVTLTNAIYPEGVDDLEFRKALMAEGMIVAPGLASYMGKLFRLGHMGNVDINDEVVALGIIERALAKFGKLPKPGCGVGAYLEEMTK